MSARVLLSDELFVAEGKEHQCFRHPDDSQTCIKVLRPDRSAGRFFQEVSYHSSLRRRGVGFEHVAGFHGLIETNLGRGSIFDLVMDDDAQVSKSLDFYLRQQDEHFVGWVADAMENLKQYLHAQWIVCHDLNPTNILAQRLGFDEYRLVVIDGVGHNHLIPLASYSPRLARKKLIRVWNRRYRQWYQQFPSIMTRLQPYPQD